MPCSSKRNYGEDYEDAIKLAKQFDIETRVVDLTEAKKALVEANRKKQPKYRRLLIQT